MDMATKTPEVLQQAGIGEREMLLKQMGRTIVDLRETKGWSRKELAVALSVNWNTLGRWERGERQPSLPILLRLNGIFGSLMHETVLSVPMKAPEVMKGDAQ